MVTCFYGELDPGTGEVLYVNAGHNPGLWIGASGATLLPSGGVPVGPGRDRGAAVALTPLARVQQATVLALVEARRLDVVPSDVARATSFLRQAEERLNQLPLLTSVVVRNPPPKASTINKADSFPNTRHEPGETRISARWCGGPTAGDRRAYAARLINNNAA